MNGTLGQILGGMSAVSALAFGIGLANLLRKKSPRLVAWCFLIAGIGLSGWIGVLLKSSMAEISRIFDRVGQSLIGASVVLVVGSFLVTWLIHDLRKKGGVSKIAPYLALVVPSFLPLFLAALATIPALRDVATQISVFFASMEG